MLDVRFGVYSSKFTDTVVPISPSERIRLNNTLFKEPLRDDEDLRQRVEDAYILAFASAGDSDGWIRTILRQASINYRDDMAPKGGGVNC